MSQFNQRILLALTVVSLASSPCLARFSDRSEGRIDHSEGRIDYSGGRGDHSGERIDYSGERGDHSGERIDHTDPRDREERRMDSLPTAPFRSEDLASKHLSAHGGGRASPLALPSSNNDDATPDDMIYSETLPGYI